MIDKELKGNSFGAKALVVLVMTNIAMLNNIYTFSGSPLLHLFCLISISIELKLKSTSLLK